MRRFYPVSVAGVPVIRLAGRLFHERMVVYSDLGIMLKLTSSAKSDIDQVVVSVKEMTGYQKVGRYSSSDTGVAQALMAGFNRAIEEGHLEGLKVCNKQTGEVGFKGSFHEVIERFELLKSANPEVEWEIEPDYSPVASKAWHPKLGEKVMCQLENASCEQVWIERRVLGFSDDSMEHEKGGLLVDSARQDGSIVVCRKFKERQ